jgi:hypothetical protein
MKGKAAAHDRIVKATAAVARIEFGVLGMLSEADVFMAVPGNGIRLKSLTQIVRDSVARDK